MLLKILVRLFDDGRSQLPSHELVDRGEQHRALGRELLSAVGSPARIRDGGHVVRAEMPLDELPGGIDDDLRPQRGDVEIVEHDHVQTAADWLRVGFHVAHAPWRAGGRALADGTGMSTSENALISCGLPSSRSSKSSFGEIGDEVSALVGHDGVDVDEVHLDLECRGGRGLLLRRGEQGRDCDRSRAEKWPEEGRGLA